MNVPEYLIQVYINEHRIEKFESRLAKVGFVNINESKKKKKGEKKKIFKRTEWGTFAANDFIKGWFSM